MFDPSRIDHDAFHYYTRLRKVKRYVDANYSEPLDLQSVADIAGLEKTYFSRFFHQKTGVCFHEWLTWVRVGHAINLLAYHDRPITEVALDVGFQDLRTFERAVARCTGNTPRDVRRSLRETDQPKCA